MRNSQVGWLIAVLLTMSLAAVNVAAFAGANEGSCTPACYDPVLMGSITAFGLLGVAVSASIGQLSKRRPTYVQIAIKLGAVVFFLGSLVSLISTSPVAIGLVFVSIIVALLAATTREDLHSKHRAVE
jgi:hypothetical protein